MQSRERLVSIINEIANRPISLGEHPWSKEDLRRSYFQNHAKVREKVDILPGAKVEAYLKSLEFLYQLLCDSVDSLIETAGVFRCEAQKGSIFGSDKTRKFNDLEFSIQKNIFACSTWTYAIESYCRKSKIPNKSLMQQIERKRSETFDHNEKYLFLKALRHSITHLPPIYPPHWQVIWSRRGKQVKFVFDSNRLSKARDRSDKKESRELLLSFICKNPIVDIEELCKQSRGSVGKFYNWLVAQVKNNSQSELNEYHKYTRWLTHFDKEAFINTARQVKNNKKLNVK